MNYCQSCRRHLNGALSCPGCGAVTILTPEAQDSRSTDWRTEVAWPGRNPLAPMESRGAASARERVNRDVARADTHPAVLAKRPAAPPAGAGAHAKAHAAEGLHAVRRPPLRSDDKPDEREPVRGGDPAPDSPNGHRGHRPRKRRGLGLKVTVTGSFAGIAVISLLVLGNLPPTAGGDAAAGTIAAVSTSAPQSPGTNSSSGVPTQALTDSDPRSTASSNASATSPSPGPSGTPDPSAASAQAQQSKNPATRSGAQSPSPATQATPPPAPSPSPSPSQAQGSCFLIICW